MYRQNFHFILPDRTNQYKTVQGALLSLITITIIITFSAYKILSLVSYDEYKVQVREKENFYEASDHFGPTTSEFYVAAALTAFDGDSNDISDPQIGELKFYKKSWSGSSSDNDFLKVEIPT